MSNNVDSGSVTIGLRGAGHRILDLESQIRVSVPLFQFQMTS